MNNNLTVFTPTYNRAYILEKSYHALCRQTRKDFIWLIVDDGSSDHTRGLVKEWKTEKKISIDYIYQENAGKQRAVNTGLINCKTKYFAFLDSDDCYCDNTVEKFLELFAEIEDDKSIAGILARKGSDKNNPIGCSHLPKGKYIANYDELVRKYHYYGDTCRAYKTSILREHLYPEIADKFILESVMLSAVDQEYHLLIVNEVFTISEYLPDGYTNNCQRLYHDNPYGYALGISQITIAKRGVLRQIKYTILFSIWCKVHDIKDAYQIVKNKELFVLTYPFSILGYILRYPRWFFEGN